MNLVGNNTRIKNKKKYYRADIDGLRALAIIPVLLYHFGVVGFTGGFVGVDIFFVISGYLITSIILREINKDTFSLLRFWGRRIRRIIPALFTVVTATIVGANFILLYPQDYIKFGTTVLAQSFFMVNMMFMRIHSYFAAPSETIPLLHTWSLAVEEQFYFIFPILMLAIAFFAKKYIKIIFFVVAVASFVLSVYLVNIVGEQSFTIPFLPHIWGGATNASAGFYFLPARAWELCVGALLAISGIVIFSKKISEIISFVGFFAIVFAVVCFTKETQFPGVAALFPVLGAAAIIVGNTKHNTMVQQLLSKPVLVWVGLISYSLYLWHWPILVFFKYIFLDTLSFVHIIVMFCLSVILAWLTYYFIETPFRKKEFCSKQTHIFMFGFSALVLVGITGYLISNSDGMLWRISGQAKSIAMASVDINPRTEECFKNNYKRTVLGREPCKLGVVSDNSDVDFILFGNSHADAIMPVIDKMATEYNVTGVFFGVGGCLPVIGDIELSNDRGCQAMKSLVVEYVDEYSIKNILLVSPWKNVGRAYYQKKNAVVGDDTNSLTVMQEEQAFKDVLVGTINTFSNQNIFIMKEVPRHEGYNVREIFQQSVMGGDDIVFPDITYSDHVEMNLVESFVIDSLEKDGKLTVIDPAEVLCVKDGVCSLNIDDVLVYRDDNHLTATGSFKLRSVFQPFFSFMIE